MTIPLFCVFLAMLMLLVTKAPVAVAMSKLGGYDNHHPRAQQSELKGWGARALSAHKNEIEAFPLFAAGVFIAHLAGGDPLWAARLAITFLIARVLYMILYILDYDIVRSLVWSVGFGCTLLLALLPYLKG